MTVSYLARTNCRSWVKRQFAAPTIRGLLGVELPSPDMTVPVTDRPLTERDLAGRSRASMYSMPRHRRSANGKMGVQVSATSDAVCQVESGPIHIRGWCGWLLLFAIFSVSHTSVRNDGIARLTLPLNAVTCSDTILGRSRLDASAPARRPSDAITKGLSFPAACRLKSRVETAGESPVLSGIREDVLYSLERGAIRSPFYIDRLEVPARNPLGRQGVDPSLNIHWLGPAGSEYSSG